MRGSGVTVSMVLPGDNTHHAAAREAHEEGAVQIDPDHIALDATNKCAKLQWVTPGLLPSTTIAYSAEGIRAWVEGTAYRTPTGDHGPAS